MGKNNDNTSQKLPEQLLKSQVNDFFEHNNCQTLKYQKCVNFLSKILNLEIIYQPLDLNLNPKEGLLTAKTTIKHFPNSF